LYITYIPSIRCIEVSACLKKYRNFEKRYYLVSEYLYKILLAFSQFKCNVKANVNVYMYMYVGIKANL